MSRNYITKDEIKSFILEQKFKLNQEKLEYTSDPKSLANRYLNQVLDRIEEYRF
jgi:hypothetical protein